MTSLFSSPTERSSVPRSATYRALAGLRSTEPNPWASIVAPLANPISRANLLAPVPLSNLPSLIPAYQAPTPVAAKPKWIYVTRRFDQLIDAIGIRQDEIDDGAKKLGRLIASLNRCYYPGEPSETANSVIIGSWAKRTRVRPFSDIDVLFILPYEDYLRFENRGGNKQSQILTEMRTNLKNSTYPRTEIVGDRHVVIVEVDGVTIEVAPAFLLTDGRYWVCDTKDNGSYKLADPAAELQALELATPPNDNARQLTRMIKRWQLHSDVSIKTFQLERLAINFMAQWPHSQCDRFWYDWMIRDFFLYMISRADSFVRMPGTGEWIFLGATWLTAANLAYKNAQAACAYEQANLETLAGDSWQEIFGRVVPVSVS